MKSIASRPKNVRIVSACIAVVLLVVASYVFASIMQWRAIDQKLQSQLALNKKTSKAALNTSYDRTARLEATHALSTMRTATDSLCQSQWWYGWQTGLTGGIKHSFDECHATKKKLVRIVDAATEVDSYVNDETKLITILKGLVITQKQLTEKNWQSAAIDTADKVQTELTALKTSSAFAPTAKEAVTRVTTITAKWKLFLAANKKQDKAAYTSSLDAVDQAYVDLANITDVSDTQVETHVTRLQTAMNAL